MKKFIPLLALLILLTGCETRTGSKETVVEATPDADAARKEVAGLMDSFHNAMKNKKATDFKNLLDPKGLFCGTDPSEIYDRDTYAQLMGETLSNPMLGAIAYTVDTREIRIDESGTTATILEQYKVNLFSPEIPWRLVSHAVKKEGAWVIDFLSFTLVPTNAQQESINKAVDVK
ncbi:nuclear transport factor 2 family protein [uncultured Flavobacterium sp.]|uniref:nuclear transport factor 2 family protein n=1 Tax=uncultured Flavobacterium sp. TaxID=165435 RepID=UPI0025D17002|nr:nuclear transport factor 2 family protein [uncultured Flavobacterium sp.]